MITDRRRWVRVNAYPASNLEQSASAVLDVGKNAHPAQDIWVSCALQRYNRGVSQRKESMEAQEQTQQVQSAGVKSEVVMPEGQLPENPAAAPAAEEAAPHGESTVAVVAAIIANIAIGIVKFIASAISGSSAMFSEGVHSIVDSGNGMLVLLGIHRAKKPADPVHPFGHGKELYFWTMVVAILIFALGGGVSMWEGIQAVREVGPDTKLGDPTMAYIVLAISMVIEGVSLSIAIKQFNAARGKTSPLKFIKEAKDPSLYTVVLEDTAAETGLVLAFLGVFLGHAFNNPYLDGIAAICIGLLLAGVAAILLRETKGLLIGEGLNLQEVEEVQRITESDPAIERCGRVLSMYMGPENLVVNIDAGFRPGIPSDEIPAAVDRIEAGIKARFPQARSVFIEAEGLKTVQLQHDAFEMISNDVTAEDRFFGGS